MTAKGRILCRETLEIQRYAAEINSNWEDFMKVKSTHAIDGIKQELGAVLHQLNRIAKFTDVEIEK